MTDPSNISPPQPNAPKPHKIGPAVRGFIVAFVFSFLIVIKEMKESRESPWIALWPIAFFIVILAGLFSRPTRHFSIGALLFVGVALLVFFSCWGINRLTTMI